MKRYNVILILIDGARVDRLSQSKEFLNLIKEGTFFSQMIAHAPYTLVSMNSIFTGMYGGRNGIDAYYKMFKLKEECKTLAEYLANNGWHTQGDAMRLSLVSNRGFKKLTEHDESNTDYSKVHCDMMDEIIKNKEKDQPFFAYLHYPKIHTSIVQNVFSKYDDFSDEYFENKENNLINYDSYLKSAGEYLQIIYDKLLSNQLDKNSIIIVMSDHGMGVGEKKGERAYGVYTYDYSIRSFAIFIQPELFPKGKDILDLTRTIDIMPTILDILGISTDNSFLKMQGESLMPLLKDKKRFKKKLFFSKNSDFERVAYAETGGLYGPWPSPNEPNVKCVRTSKWKLIHNLTPDTCELYDLEEDPEEKINVIDKYPKIVKQLKDKHSEIEKDCKSAK